MKLKTKLDKRCYLKIIGVTEVKILLSKNNYYMVCQLINIVGVCITSIRRVFTIYYIRVHLFDQLMKHGNLFLDKELKWLTL